MAAQDPKQAPLEGKSTPSLVDLPPEVLLHNVLPLLPLRDLLTVSRVDKELNALANDPSLWRVKTEADFSYNDTSLALAAPAYSAGRGQEQAAWYKRVYRGLYRPRVYLWGESNRGRLTDTLDREFYWPTPADVTGCFTVPDRSTRVPIGLVDLQAGGWSFSARDQRGGVWIWGTLDGERYSRGTWGDAGYQVATPSRLPLPGRASAIAQGRRHLLVLDQDNLIWEMRAWGLAYQHTATQLTAPTQTGAGAPGRPPSVAQIAAGWQTSAALMSSGEIHVWFPFRVDYKDSCTPEEGLSPGACADGVDLSKMQKWGRVSGDVLDTLPALPERPEDAPWESSERPKNEQVIKIACGIDFLLALKRNGEVWAIKTTEPQIGQWEFMANFSSPSITHITAQFEMMVSYAAPSDPSGSSKVYLGALRGGLGTGAGATLQPQTVPGLDDLQVVQVVAGDWHWSALTAKGELYTWGQNGQGQLGLGHRNAIREPTRVSLPDEEGHDGEERPAFAFAVTAAGMQTGVLVLGHKGKSLKPQVVETEEPGIFGRALLNPIFRTMRVGFAGRGAMRGMGSRGGGPSEK